MRAFPQLRRLQTVRMGQLTLPQPVQIQLPNGALAGNKLPGFVSAAIPDGAWGGCQGSGNSWWFCDDDERKKSVVASPFESYEFLVPLPCMRSPMLSSLSPTLASIPGKAGREPLPRLEPV